MDSKLDRYDRAILRVLIEFLNKPLSTNEIAKKIEVSPITAKKHLDSMEDLGYVEKEEVGEGRVYFKDGEKNNSAPKVYSFTTNDILPKQIRAPSKILWKLRYKN